MNSLCARNSLAAWLFAGCLCALDLPCAGQFTQDKQSELMRSVVQCLNDQKPDEAIAMVKERASGANPPPDVADAMFAVSRFLFVREKNAESLDLLQEITKKFPGTSTASLAWCGMGQVYGKLGDNSKMIAALEQGMSAPRVFTETNIMDASDTHNYACEVLGEHYVKTAQWEKALRVYSDWRPNSWCGTCLDSMKASRVNNILLCQVHLGQFADAITSGWREMSSPGFDQGNMGLFVLVRLYAEAGQLQDLERLNLKLVEAACQRFPSTGNATNQFRLRAIIKASASMSDAITRVEQRSVDDHLNVIDAGDNSSSAVRHVARWVLLREHQRSVPRIERAALRAGSRGSAFLELLAAIDTPAARDALVRLAIGGDVYRQQMACGLIRHRMKDADPLIARIVAGVPEDRARFTNWNVEPVPSRDRFYESWTPLQHASLPRNLPDSLFVERDRR